MACEWRKTLVAAALLLGNPVLLFWEVAIVWLGSGTAPL